MEADQFTKEYKKECNNLFPNIDKKVVEPTFNTFVEILEAFFNEISKNKRVKYLEGKPDGTDSADYLSHIPEGVESFEKWTHKGLSDLSSNILHQFNILWPCNITYFYFAKYLDDQDFDSFVKHVNIPEEQRKDIKDAYDSFFKVIELKPILLAIGSAATGLNNTAHALISHAIQKLMFEDEDFYEVLNKAKKLEIVRKKGQKDSKKSNDIKHAKIRKIKEFAIKLYLMGSYPSVKNCSENIAEQVLNYAHNSEEIQKLPGKEIRLKANTLPRTIERWIGQYNKEQKALKKSHS
jgi:hypothetical protein